MRAYNRIYNYVATHGTQVMVNGVLTQEVVNATFVCAIYATVSVCSSNGR